MLKNKQGSIVDIAFLLVAVLGVAIFILIVGFVFPTITDQIKNHSAIGDNANSVTALDSTDALTTRFDMIFIAIFAGLCMAVLVSSFFIDSSLILLPVYIIALSILMIFAVVCEKVYASFSENSTFAATAAQHTMTAFIMNNLIFIAIGVGVLSMILIFSKPRGGAY